MMTMTTRSATRTIMRRRLLCCHGLYTFHRLLHVAVAVAESSQGRHSGAIFVRYPQALASASADKFRWSTKRCLSTGASSNGDGENESNSAIQSILSCLKGNGQRSQQQLEQKGNGVETKGMNHDASLLLELTERLPTEYIDLPPIRLSNPPSLLSNSTDPSTSRAFILQTIAMQMGPASDTEILAASKALTKHMSREATTEVGIDTQLHIRKTLSLQQKLRDALTPQYEDLFRIMMTDHAQTAIRFLIALRQDLLQLLMANNSSPGAVQDQHVDVDEADTVQHLKQLDGHLKTVLTTWFSPEALGECVVDQRGTLWSVHTNNDLTDSQLFDFDFDFCSFMLM